MLTNWRNWLVLIGIVSSVLYGFSVHAAILIQTGFEQDPLGKIPENPPDAWQSSGGGFEISSAQVKEGKQSLAILGGGGDQALAVMLNTQSDVVSAEFWLYVEGAARSLTVFLQDAAAGLTDWGAAGPYINWNADTVRHYPGAWEEIGEFPSGEWLYVRLVVNSAQSEWAFYAGDGINQVHSEAPMGEGLGFRSPLAAPVGKLLFGTYSLASPAYVDDLLVYEGDVLPEGILSVSPSGMLTTTWASLRK